jgi:hypothetical protein
MQSLQGWVHIGWVTCIASTEATLPAKPYQLPANILLALQSAPFVCTASSGPMDATEHPSTCFMQVDEVSYWTNWKAMGKTHSAQIRELASVGKLEADCVWTASSDRCACHRASAASWLQQIMHALMGMLLARLHPSLYPSITWALGCCCCRPQYPVYIESPWSSPINVQCYLMCCLLRST